MNLTNPNNLGPRRLARRGSILIIVVAILVLLAIMGTAFISTARIDRQTVTNREEDPDIAAVMGLANDAIKNDIIVGGVARPAGVAAYEHFDAPQVDPITFASYDKWLGARLPELVGLSYDGDNTADMTNVPVWSYTADVGQTFEDVERGGTLTFPDVPNAAVVAMRRYAFVPTSKSINFRTNGVELSPKEYPAFRVLVHNGAIWRGVNYNATLNAGMGGWEYSTGPSDTQWRKYIAGDADGDGIADSLLFRLPDVDGRTYFGGLRIIDNGSAINVNTAGSSTTDVNGVAAVLPETVGMFPAHVGLFQLMAPGTTPDAPIDRWNALNQHRFNSTAAAPTVNMAGRADFAYGSQAESHFFGFTRRIEEPADNAPGLPFQEFDSTVNGASLAYRFSMASDLFTTSKTTNTDTTGAAPFFQYNAAGALIDRALGPSLYATSLNHVAADVANPFVLFPASESDYWYDWNFYYGKTALQVTNAAPSTDMSRPETEWRPIRALVTTENALSTAVPLRQVAAAGGVPNVHMLPYLPMPAAHNGAATYAPGDLVSVTTGSQTNVYRYLETAAGNTTPMPYDPTNAAAAASNVAWARESWTNTSTRTGLNTAGFAELWRAFWSVMREEATGTAAGTPFDAEITAAGPIHDPYVGSKFDRALKPYTATAGDVHPARMFRSAWRALMDGAAFSANTPRLTHEGELQLRAAIAATNAEDWRDSDHDVTARQVVLPATVDTAATNVRVTIYGNEAQPFITEVYVQTDTTVINHSPANPNGYIAIELYNPYPFPIDIVNCRLALVDRTPVAGTYNTTPNMAIAEMGGAATLATATSNLDPTTPLAPTIIPANGYLVIENFDVSGAGAGAALHRPAATLLPLTTPIVLTNKNYAFVAGLENIIGVDAGGPTYAKELVLLRPLSSEISAVTTALTYLNVGAAVPTIDSVALAPLDQFDFTGFPLPAAGTYAWHYSRAAGDVAGKAWNFVYPGRYDAAPELPAPPTPSPRHQGTQAVTWVPTVPADDPWDPANVLTPDPAIPPIITLDDVPPAVGDASYDVEFTIQLAQQDWPALNRIAAAAGNAFPFGGFARTGDVLQVPFIGAYRINPLTFVADSVYELNAVTMDAAMAEDTDPADDAPNMPYPAVSEQIGRFCPVGDPTAAATFRGDFDTTPAAGVARYRWASDVFDYFTAIQNPKDDYFPNVRPQNYKFPIAGGAFTYVTLPEAVKNVSAGANANSNEDAIAPIEGTININTAPWPVLASVPWTNVPAGNIAIAQAIVADRNLNGPYATIFDLARVMIPGGNLLQAWRIASGAPFPAEAIPDDGELTADPAAGDLVSNDYEEAFLTLTRVSNLITTRSDAFTVYGIAQEWRNIGTPTPEMVKQLRAAVIADRSAIVTPINTVQTTEIPVK